MLIMESWERLIDVEIRKKYELYNFNHAVEIMTQAYEEEWQDLTKALTDFYITREELLCGGGNESAIPKRFSSALRPRNWQEIKITGDLIVKLHSGKPKGTEERKIVDFIDGHKIDYVKGELAVDMEWNSKDQTFDRDLYAFRTFYECGIIKCGAIITRSAALDSEFKSLGIKKKYGASTTWMGKLIPRIHSGRHGGCPLMVIGIKPQVISNWEEKGDIG